MPPAVCLGEECELIFRTAVGKIWFVNKSMVCSQEDLIYGLRPLKVVCNGLMPKSMVLLAVASRVPSMWYSLFDRNFLLEMFRVLHFAMPRLICKV